VQQGCPNCFPALNDRVVLGTEFSCYRLAADAQRREFLRTLVQARQNRGYLQGATCADLREVSHRVPETVRVGPDNGGTEVEALDQRGTERFRTVGHVEHGHVRRSDDVGLFGTESTVKPDTTVLDIGSRQVLEDSVTERPGSR